MSYDYPAINPDDRRRMRLWEILCRKSSLLGDAGVTSGLMFDQGESDTAAFEVDANIDTVFAGKPAPTGTPAPDITGGNH